MRDKGEIKRELGAGDSINYTLKLVLEVALDIRDLLRPAPKETMTEEEVRALYCIKTTL